MPSQHHDGIPCERTYKEPAQPEGPYEAWRRAMVSQLNGRGRSEAADALLALALSEPDRVWIEDLLVQHLPGGGARQDVRELAVVCLGHVGRIHGAVSGHVLVTLRVLLDDPDLAGAAENALGDIEIFASEKPPPRRA